MTSDKENEQPGTRENTPRRGKARGLRGTSARMPTPDSGSAAGNGNKRRRTDNYTPAKSRVYEYDDDDEEEEEEEEEEEDGDDGANDEVQTPSQLPPESDEEGDLKFYNPNQDPEKRRKLRATMRDHQRMVDGKFHRGGARRPNIAKSYRQP
jgi:hypothetical protein